MPPNASKGESKVKTVDGKSTKWCEKCRQGKGLWTVGNGLHSTEQHRGRSNKTEESNEAANLGVVNEPLSFGFLGMALKECRGE